MEARVARLDVQQEQIFAAVKNDEVTIGEKIDSFVASFSIRSKP